MSHHHSLWEDLVLLKNRNTTALQTKYVPNYRIIKKIGDRAVDLRDNFGNIRRANIDDIQTMYPVDFLLVPFTPLDLVVGRTAKYINDPRMFHSQLAKSLIYPLPFSLAIPKLERAVQSLLLQP